MDSFPVADNCSTFKPLALGQHSLHCCWNYYILDSYQTGITLLFSIQLFFQPKIIKLQTLHILSKKKKNPGQVLPNSSSLFETNFCTSLHFCLYFKTWTKSNLGGKVVFSMHAHSPSVRKLIVGIQGGVDERPMEKNCFLNCFL